MNKKSLLLFAAAPLLLAGCGKISSIPSFQKYDEATAVTYEKFMEDYSAAREAFVDRAGVEKGKGASFVLDSVDKHEGQKYVVGTVGQKMSEKSVSEGKNGCAYDGKTDVGTEYLSYKVDSKTNYGAKQIETEEESMKYQMGTVEEKSCVLRIDETNKTYRGSGKTSVQDEVHDTFDEYIREGVDYSVQKDSLTKYYEKDGLFTVILKKTLSDYTNVKPEVNMTKHDYFYELQFLFEGDRYYCGEYEIDEQEFGETANYKSKSIKTESGAYIEAKIGETSVKAADISKYQLVNE